MWKSVRFLVRLFSGEVNRDSSERPYEATGVEVLDAGMAYAHMLLEVLLMFVCLPRGYSLVPSKPGYFDSGHT